MTPTETRPTPAITQRLATITLWALLLLPLVASPMLGLLTPYVSLVFVIPLFFVTLFRGQFVAAYRDYTAAALLAAFVVIAIICSVTAHSFGDALHAFNFTMILAYGVAAYFLARHASPRSVPITAGLAASGVVIALGYVLILMLLRHGHGHRPSGPNLGPIVLSNALLALGFMASGAGLVLPGRRAWLAVIPPLAAIAATLVTGSRGPLLALPVVLLVAAIFYWRLRFAGSLRAGLIGLGVLGVVCGAGLLAVLSGKRTASLLNILQTVLQSGTTTDGNTSERLQLYQAGWQAFLHSPWIGYGWANVAAAAHPYLSAPTGALLRLPQLHNDVLNFAVAGGIVGVACYFAILTGPLVGAIRSARDSLRPFRLYATTLIMIVYAGGGLTDLMFGFEFHTFLFVLLNAIVLGYCREAAPSAKPAA